MPRKSAGEKKRTQNKKRSKKTAAKTKETCLIISPFGEYFDEYNDLIYKPAIASAGLNPVRAGFDSERHLGVDQVSQNPFSGP
jgi:aromatic ring-opening dioxygenase LigB subunit